MIKIDTNSTNTPFQASWNKETTSIHAEGENLLGNLARKVKNFIFYLPNSLIAACINPRSHTSHRPFFSQQQNGIVCSKEIITPDKVRLTARVDIVNGATSQTPTVILFNPLGANKKVHQGLRYELACNKKCNVVTFNYRGLGSTWSKNDLVVDGESVYQFVTQELGTQPNKVNFYGFSLGGAIAAQVKALHPGSQGKYVGDRPFRSIFNFLTENCCIGKLGSIIKKITSFASSLFLAYPVYLLGWEWDGNEALKKMAGDKRIVYHPNDFLVPYEASLASQCPPDQRIKLDPKLTGPATHFASIQHHNTEQGTPAINVIADFLAN